jgi:methionine-rich copper-binding protein CopC
MNSVHPADDRPTRRSALALVTLAGVLLALLLAPTRASAHAELIASNPAGGAVLTEPPATVTLTFTESVTDPAYVVVTGPGGDQAAEGPAPQSGTTVTQRLDLQAVPEPTGAWTVAYRVLSVDGHAMTGEIAFTVAGSGKSPPAPESQAGGKAEPPPADESQADATTASPSSDSPPWYASSGWLVLGITAALCAGVPWLLRRRRHA